MPSPPAHIKSVNYIIIHLLLIYFIYSSLYLFRLPANEESEMDSLSHIPLQNCSFVYLKIIANILKLLLNFLNQTSPCYYKTESSPFCSKLKLHMVVRDDNQDLPHVILQHSALLRTGNVSWDILVKRAGRQNPMG